MSARLVVIGGGLAGMAAALRLAEAGHRPLLIETKKKLGGRATSFVDPRNQQVLDNCQHVVMGCCTNLLDFYERLGVLDQIDWQEQLYWTTGRGDIVPMKASRWPAPLHLATAFKKLPGLDAADRKAIRNVMWKLIRLGPTGRVSWTGRLFLDFLHEFNQTDTAIRNFWNVIITSACNIDVARCEASYGFQVFQDGFLANRFGHVMGLSRVPLWELYEPAIEIIEGLGGDVVDGISAKSIAFDGKRVTGVITSDGMIKTSAVVSAVPHDRLAKLASATLIKSDRRLQRLDAFEFSPILGAHLWFETEIFHLPHMVLVDHETHWLFNKGLDNDGQQHLHVVISAADDWMKLSEDEISQRVMADIHSVIPKSRGLEPVAIRAVKEKRATFACVPGIDAIRPGATPDAIGSSIGSGSGVSNLYLAGDWCNTGWPATMEGAIRSGYQAAAAVVGVDSMLVPDLPPSSLARMLGLRS